MAESDERYTPQGVLDVVRAVAPIGLDPCTTKDNPTGAKRWFTAEDNGLGKAWFGEQPELAFVNPPYSRGQLLLWALQVLEQVHQARGHEAIVLTPCDLGTKWAQALFEGCTAFAGWRGRIEFLTPDGSFDAGAKQPSLFWYFGERAERFARVFRDRANVVRGGW